MQHHRSSSLLALSLLALLGAGCAGAPAPEQAAPQTPPAPTPTLNAPSAVNAGSDQTNTLMATDTSAEADPDFTAGSEYMRETPQRYADLNGKRPYLLYFYADWDLPERDQHTALVKLFDSKKFGTPLLRVNFKDNQVTDEGVAWAKALNVAKENTTIAFDASGKEVVRWTGALDEAKLTELMAKANGK